MEKWIPHVGLDLVSFDDINSHSLGLLLIEKSIGTATPKTNYIEIPCADGMLDLTEAFGEVKYKNRNLNFKFVTRGNHDDVYDKVMNALNGKFFNIELSDDEDYIYKGRVSVSDWSEDNAFGYINISADCEPYRYKKELTKASIELTEELQDITLVNKGRLLTPKFTATGKGSIKLGDTIVEFAPSTFTSPLITLKYGGTTLSVKGDGKLDIEYQERRL